MRRELSLNGTWQLACMAQDARAWEEAPAPYPISAPVPGEVHPALQEAGIIPDPFYGMQAKDAEWVEDKDWWYRCTFRLPEGFQQTQTFLEFDGLDTFATVLLDAQVIGQADNMFLPIRFDVTDRLGEGEEHVLEVRFTSAARVMAATDLEGYMAHHSHDRIGARKYQAVFGWDWIPRLVGAGIWRGVRVVSYDRLAIHDMHVVPRADTGLVETAVEIDNPTGLTVNATIVARIDGRKASDRRVQFMPGRHVVHMKMMITNPASWWPNGHGGQPLYTVGIEVWSDNQLIDQDSRRFAFRDIELQLRDEAENPVFRFLVNGRPIFIKGSNWVPADVFPSRTTPERYRRLLELARDAGINMIRVWGGGIYEAPLFYDLCDELGLMVWQDFMFSFAEYPEWPSFTGSVAREARAMVRELRNHPSLALWCGNNECEMDIPVDAAWKGKGLFHDLINGIVRELDPSRPYWPSSPYGGEKGRSSEEGDYHGEPWFKALQFSMEHWHEQFDGDMGLFMSEFPTQGPPEVESLKHFIPQKELFPTDGPVWEWHDKDNEIRHEKIGMTSHQALLVMISGMMGEPRSIEEFAEWGGVLQGEFLQAQIGHYRRRRLGGAMFWMLADAWPATGFSVIDYYLRPKPAYYYARRAFAPLSLVFSLEDGRITAWAISDRAQPVKGQVTISFITDGKPDPHTAEMPVAIPANGVVQVWSSMPPQDLARQWVTGSIEVNGEVVARASYFFTLFKYIRFPEAKLRVERSHVDETLTFTISSDVYARTVVLANLPDTARAQDNYFDLSPGETRQVRVDNISTGDAERVLVRQGYRFTERFRKAA